MHDSSLKRMCNVDKKICETDYAELLTYSLGNGMTIPLLTDVLKVLDGVPLICEIKTDKGNTDCEICPYVTKLLDGYKGAYCIESFSPFVIRWLKKNRPDIIRGQLAMNFSKNSDSPGKVAGFLAGNLIFNFLGVPDFIAYGLFPKPTLGFRLVRRAFNPYTAAWTVRNEELLKASDNFDVVIFEAMDSDKVLRYKHK